MSLLSLIELLVRVLLALLAAGSDASEEMPLPSQAPVVVATPTVLPPPTITPVPTVTPTIELVQVPFWAQPTRGNSVITKSCNCPDPIKCLFVASIPEGWRWETEELQVRTNGDGNVRVWINCVPPAEFPADLTEQLLLESRIDDLTCSVPGCDYVPGYQVKIESPVSADNTWIIRFFYQPPGRGYFPTNVLGLFVELPTAMLDLYQQETEFVLSRFHAEEAPPPAPTATPAPSTTPSFGGGTLRIGADIQPGTYGNTDSSGLCYWERLSGFSGEFDDIIANGLASNLTIVTISEI